MTRADAYRHLAEELERWRRLPKAALAARIGVAIPPRTVRIGQEDVSIEIGLEWADSGKERVRVHATANGPGHWKLERLEEEITIPLTHEPNT